MSRKIGIDAEVNGEFATATPYFPPSKIQYTFEARKSSTCLYLKSDGYRVAFLAS